MLERTTWQITPWITDRILSIDYSSNAKCIRVNTSSLLLDFLYLLSSTIMLHFVLYKLVPLQLISTLCLELVGSERKVCNLSPYSKHKAAQVMKHEVAQRQKEAKPQ